MEEQIDRAHLELQQMIQTVNDFACNSTMLLNDVLSETIKWLKKLEAKVKVLENADTKEPISAELVNHSLIIIGDRLDRLDEKVKALENAGHIVRELPEIEEATSSHRDQLDLPFQFKASDIEKGEQK